MFNFYGSFFYINHNNNNNTNASVYAAIIMTEPLWEFTRFKRPPTLSPSQTTWAASPSVGCQSLHPPSPFIIITQPESLYSFYRPTEGRRLSRSSWPITYQDGLPVQRRSPILGLTGSDVAQLRWSRPTRYHWAKLPTNVCLLNGYTLKLEHLAAVLWWCAKSSWLCFFVDPLCLAV